MPYKNVMEWSFNTCSIHTTKVAISIDDYFFDCLFAPIIGLFDQFNGNMDS